MHEERTDPVNWSTLKAMAVSPKHYLHGLTEERVETEAMLLGTLTHARVLEPETVLGRFCIAPNFHRGCNDETAIAKGYDGGKQAAAEWDAELDSLGAEPVSQETWDAALLMAASVANHPLAQSYLTGGVAEKRITWTAPNGIKCRGRVDYIAPNGLVDFKTTRSIATFERDVFRMNYHAQVAWYDWGASMSDDVDHPQPFAPVIIAVESCAPYDVGVYIVDGDAYDHGFSLSQRLLGQLYYCRLVNEWRGVTRDEPTYLQLPAWARPKEDHQ
jgi:hypothetical protein